MEQMKKLLIADDKRGIHDVISQALPAHQFEIIHAYDGKTTVRLAEEELPEVILLDILMPDLDGRDICKRLKSQPQTEQIKIIMITGRADQHDRLLGLQLGADDYITKPFSMNYLARRIDRLLQKDR